MNNNPVKVLLVVYWMNRGGVENLLMNIFRNTDRSKLQFDFVVHSAQRGAFDDEIEALGGKIYRCCDYKIYNHFQYTKWWNSFFEEHKEYRIIHSHLDSCANIHLRIAKKHGLKTIAHAHTISEGSGVRAAAKKFLKIGFNSCCDYKFACSKTAAEWLYGKQADKSRIINNAIDVKKFAYNSQTACRVKKGLGIAENTFVVGHVGRIDPPKNHSFLVEIFAEICKINSNSVLLLVGFGELENEIHQKVKNLGIESNVKFLGVREDVSSLLQAMDVFVFPSLFEGFPVTLVEAQAAGLPCIISSAITGEVCFTSLVKQISLESSAQMWAKEVLSFKGTQKKDTTEAIRAAGYDISSVAKELEEFYRSLV